jgi:hypothetical protein
MRSLVHRLFMLLAAITVVVAPVSITEASAAVAGHARMMRQMGHCGMRAGRSTSRDKMTGKICCVSMSAAVSMAPPTPILIELGNQAPATSAIEALHLGYLGDIATPPPRRS